MVFLVKIKNINTLFYFGIFTLLLAYVFVRFSGRGAFGSEDLYGYGRVIAVTILLIAIFILFNFKHFYKKPPLLSVILLWLLWTPITCINLTPYGSFTVFFALIQMFYCPSFFLFFYIGTKQQPRKTKITTTFFWVLLANIALLYFFVFKIGRAHV